MEETADKRGRLNANSPRVQRTDKWLVVEMGPNMILCVALSAKDTIASIHETFVVAATRIKFLIFDV